MDHGITNRPTVYNAPKLERGKNSKIQLIDYEY